MCVCGVSFIHSLTLIRRIPPELNSAITKHIDNASFLVVR